MVFKGSKTLGSFNKGFIGFTKREPCQVRSLCLAKEIKDVYRGVYQCSCCSLYVQHNKMLMAVWQ